MQWAIATETITLAEKKHNEHIKKVIQKERPRLLNYLKRRLPSLEDAEDVMQDVFLEFTKAFRMPLPIDKESAWLYRTATNKITDLFRKKRPASFSEFIDVDDDFEWWVGLITVEESSDDRLFNDFVMTAITSALSELPEAQRNAFIRHEVDGLSFKQISKTTGIPVPTLISQKRYAVLALKKQLEPLYREMTNSKSI